MVWPEFVRRSISRVLLAGGVAVVLVAGVGFGVERLRYGRDTAAARGRIDAEVRQQFATVIGRVDSAVKSLSADLPATLSTAPADLVFQRHLFDLTAAAAARVPLDGLALSIYDANGQPLAWTGRPRDLAPARILGPPSLFLESGPVGLHLVHVAPIARGPRGSAPIGSIVAEAPLATRQALSGPVDSVLLQTSVVPVRLHPQVDERARIEDIWGVVRSPFDEPLAQIEVADRAIEEARSAWRAWVLSGVQALLCLAILLSIGPLMDWRRLVRQVVPYAGISVGIVAMLVLARALAWSAASDARVAAPPLTAPAQVHPALWPLLASPVDFLLTALTLMSLVALLTSSFEAWRRGRRIPVRPFPEAPRSSNVQFVALQLAAGAAAAAILVGYKYFLVSHLSESPVDILQFSLHPWVLERVTLAVGLVALHATVLAFAVLLLRCAAAFWIVPASDAHWRVLIPVLWLTGGLIVCALLGRVFEQRFIPAALALGVAAAAAFTLKRYRTTLRHASQATRLLWLLLVLTLPSIVFYPSLVDAAERGRRQLFSSRFAPEIINQRRDLQLHLADALGQIQELRDLDELIASTPRTPSGPVPTDAAFSVWAQTTLSEQRLTSSVELFNAEGVIVSRFALKLPEAATTQPLQDTTCDWELFEEVSPFFAEERRLLHAARSICRTDALGRVTAVGAIVVHVMLDYSNLSFISAQSPYVALLRSAAGPTPAVSEGVEFVAYGWSARPLYMSGRDAWPLEKPVFDRLARSREPFWARAERGGTVYDVYYLSDRGGVYALGHATISPFGHLVSMAELVTLSGATFVVLVIGGLVYANATERSPASGRALLREIRASFYRKLFLAFVLAAVVPVLALAFVTRAYIANLMRADIETEAIRTAASASRVVEDLGNVQARGEVGVAAIDDSLAVWLSRVVAQDVNIFTDGQLLASSERNLFASELLSTRTGGDVYRAIALDARPSFVAQESVGGYEYLIAAAPVRVDGRDGILTVPLTLRQQEIESEIDDLDRLVLLAALTFVLVGAVIGYSMAERIADPVNRLTRATQRIARGDLDARIVASSADELQRLVEAFNRMADDLQRQRAELERTNRLAAWADMARQVAHDIKNPLTPIQLNAEHLRRVHNDRGRPLGTVVDDCVSNILTQVRWLRQIAGEFSSFASSPQPRPALLPLSSITNEIVESYRAGLTGHVAIHADVPPDLPLVYVDRVLLGRALTNVIENALYAMPGGGTLTIVAVRESSDSLRLTIADTGVGMSAEGLARLFEPYFSTKASGTGLGLTIARRNVELNGGTVEVESEQGRGTSVTIHLPIPTLAEMPPVPLQV